MVTKQGKSLHHSLQEGSALLKGILQITEDAIVSVDAEHKIILFNEGAEKIFGYHKDEALGQSLGLLLPERSQALHTQYIFNFSASSDTAREMRNLNMGRGRRKNGQEFPLDAAISKIQEGGEQIFTVVLRDVTERTKTEQRCERLLNEQEIISNTITDVMVMIDTEGRLKWCNRALSDLTGLDMKQLHGRCMQEFIVEDEHQAVLDSIAACVATGTSYSELHFTTKKGTRFYQFNLVMLQSEDDIAPRIVAVGRDMEDFIQLQQQLQQTQKMEALGQLTGGIAHDFNNTLAAILGYTSLAQARLVDSSDTKLQDYLNEVLKAGERAREVVMQLLAYSRSGGSKPQAIVLGPRVKEALKMMRPILPSSTKLVTELNAVLPPVMMDPVQLHQVVMNLCINACDAMGGIGQIKLQLQTVSATGLNCASCQEPIAGEYVQLSVEDTADGILEEVLPHIFEPFYTTKEIGKGSGMGLSMVHGIVHAHWGHIVVESVQGSGTTFRLFFPAIPAAQHPAEQLEADVMLSKDNIRMPHILVVDDETSVAKFVGELLESQGYRVTVAGAGVDALNLFTAAPQAYDLIVTDQIMPGMMGTELAQAVLRLRPGFPILLCTGYSDNIDAAQILAQGLSGFLRKPIDTQQLLTLAKKLTKKKTVSTRVECDPVMEE